MAVNRSCKTVLALFFFVLLFFNPTFAMTTCETSQCRRGQSVNVTCFFDTDLIATRRDFRIVIYHSGRPTQDGHNILQCNWVHENTPDCTVSQGVEFRFDFNVPVRQQIVIYNMTSDLQGQVACHAIPSQPETIRMCKLEIENSRITTEPPSAENSKEDCETSCRLTTEPPQAENSKEDRENSCQTVHLALLLFLTVLTSACAFWIVFVSIVNFRTIFGYLCISNRSVTLESELQPFLPNKSNCDNIPSFFRDRAQVYNENVMDRFLHMPKENCSNHQTTSKSDYVGTNKSVPESLCNGKQPLQQKPLDAISIIVVPPERTSSRTGTVWECQRDQDEGTKLNVTPKGSSPKTGNDLVREMGKDELTNLNNKPTCSSKGTGNALELQMDEGDLAKLKVPTEGSPQTTGNVLELQMGEGDLAKLKVPTEGSSQATGNVFERNGPNRVSRWSQLVNMV